MWFLKEMSLIFYKKIFLIPLKILKVKSPLNLNLVMGPGIFAKIGTMGPGLFQDFQDQDFQLVPD